MEPIDVAHQHFVALSREVAEYIHAVETESDTRLKIIDRICIEVLLLPYREILAESATGTGFVDYSFSVDGRSRLIVEAKRDGRSLGCEGRQPKRGYKLSGGVFSNPTAREGIGQAIRYCGEKNAELACITNGREWVIFRGNRLGDGRDTRDGMAFTFSNLGEIEQHFAFFYSLLSYESAQKIAFRPYFLEAEGQPIRMSVFQRALRPHGSARFKPLGDLAADVDKVLFTFFHRLTGDEDPDLLEACFVETNESRHADKQLSRIAEDIVGKIRELDTGEPESLTRLVQRVTETRRREFVVIVGTKGSGKTTFIRRFFAKTLPPAVANDCVVLRVDLANGPGDSEKIVTWLDAAFLAEAERVLFPKGAEFKELEGIFYDEYTRLKKGPLAALYQSDYTQFLVTFGNWVEQQRQINPHAYFEGLLRHIVRNRKKLPVVVFDNTDHFDIEFQQRVYQYARSLYEQVICLAMLPITDRTSWQLSKHGALQSFEHEAFFLPTPATANVIEKRIKFLERRIEAERQRPKDRYFITRGIYLSVDDLTAFSRSLQRVFLGSREVSRWIGNLANHDVRRALNLVRQFVSSPYLDIVDLLKAYLARSVVDIPQHRLTKALVRGHYDIYPVGQHDFVQNIFALNADLETTPLLGLRLLQLLADVPRDEHGGALIDVEPAEAYLIGMGIELRAVRLWLDAMLKTGLCLNYDPTISDIETASRIEIAPSGRQHLYWARGSIDYLEAMAEVTPLLDETMYDSMMMQYRSHEWRRKTASFIQYLLGEDRAYCVIPDHPAYQSQARLEFTLRKVLGRLNIADGSGHRQGA